MREEEERGAALRMAIRNGFGRAMATIIDSHCTTLITGIVLFVIGTDQLRGFATTLVLGLLLEFVHRRVLFPNCVRHCRAAPLAYAIENDEVVRQNEFRFRQMDAAAS